MSDYKSKVDQSCRKKYNNVDCSVLIDSLLISLSKSQSLTNLGDGCWLQAKPLHVFDLRTMFLRFKAAIRIIRGKSFAVHYSEDV